jgi:hypothetical protein
LTKSSATRIATFDSLEQIKNIHKQFREVRRYKVLPKRTQTVPRPSGLHIIDDSIAAVTVEVAHVEMRGRLNILPRWRQRVAWLTSAGESNVDALMIFVEPGFISIEDWKKDGLRIQQRFADIAVSTDADSFRALRLIQDRYQRLVIPARDRPTLGDGALSHLGLPFEKERKSIVYVCVFPDRIELMSSEYRNLKLIEGHPLIDDLP